MLKPRRSRRKTGPKGTKPKIWSTLPGPVIDRVAYAEEIMTLDPTMNPDSLSVMSIRALGVLLYTLREKSTDC